MKKCSLNTCSKFAHNEYLVKLSNKNITIEFWTEPNQKGGLGLTLIDNKTNSDYDMTQFAMLIANYQEPFSFLSEAELKAADDFGDTIKGHIYVSALIMDKFGRKTFEGDFSAL